MALESQPLIIWLERKMMSRSLLLMSSSLLVLTITGCIGRDAVACSAEEELARLSLHYAKRIHDEAAKSPELALELRSLAANTPYPSIYGYLVNREFTPTQIHEEIDQDKQVGQLFEDLDLGQAGNFYTLVYASLHCLELSYKNCESSSFQNVKLLNLAIRKSKPPIESAPMSCTDNFKLAANQIRIDDGMFPYLMHFGICENTDVVWVFDGVGGWTVANGERLFRLCLAESIALEKCPPEDQIRIRKIWAEDSKKR